MSVFFSFSLSWNRQPVSFPSCAGREKAASVPSEQRGRELAALRNGRADNDSDAADLVAS